MSTDSLYELLDLSFGTPDVGAVNFSALYTLLHAILGRMKTERVKTTSKEKDNDYARPAQSKASLPKPSSPHGVLEERVRVMEEQLRALPTDMGNENASSKCMKLIQDLQKEVQALKESRDDLRKEVEVLNGQLSQNELKDKMAQYPVPEELSKCVMLDEMQAEFNSKRQKIQEGLQGTVSAAKDTVPVLPLNLGSPIKDDRAVTGGTPGVDNSRPHQSLSDEALCAATGRVSVGAERYPETVEALKEVVRLRDRHESLETRVGQLEANKADRTQLQHLQDLLTAMGERQIPDHVPEQLNHLRTLVDSLLEDKEKCMKLIQDPQKEVQVLRQEVDGVNGQLSQVSEGESVLMSSDTCGQSDQDTDTSQIAQLTLQTSDSDIRTAVLKLDKKVQVLMREKSDREEERSSQYKHIQEQLNSLRVKIEDHVRSSGHDQGESSHQDQSSGKDQVQSTGQDESSHQDQGQQQKEDHDLNQEDSQLPKSDYKPPKDKITHIKNQELQDRIKNIDVASDVKGVLLELQADNERLHGTSRRLMEEHSEKQLHIDRLYKVLEELDEKKADKELVEMKIVIKADKQALESKVSRMQFDSVIEQLNNMLQELLGKISGQEKDWNKLIEKISTEMDCKLNRIELDPLKKQLDDFWGNIHKNMQTQSLPEQDDAAGFRKQLLAHCISCDRPVDMMTPGPLTSTLPLAPVLPSTRSSRRQKVQEPSQSPTSMAPKHPYSQGLPDLPRTRFRPTRPPVKRNSWTLSKQERIPKTADYSNLSRVCGGSHTLTYPSRRYTRIQHITHLIQSDEESQPMSSELHTQIEAVNIMDLNEQVYEGRMNSRAVSRSETRLPPISSPEGNRRRPTGSPSPKGPV